MNILLVSYTIPESDKYAGDLRLYRLLKILAERHQVTFYSNAVIDPRYRATHPDVDFYLDSLRATGVEIEHGSFRYLLTNQSYEVIVFEWYGTANRLLEDARLWHAHARIVVDSIDVHFRRLLTKAQLTRNRRDIEIARNTKREEMAVYTRADVVIAISDPDKNCLLQENPRLNVYVIPLIHSEYEPHSPDQRIENSLLFVGNFNHEPNADAIRYFCREVFPLIESKKPEVRLKIVGSNPPEDFKALLSDKIEILGYVDDLTPYLKSSWVSIAPLRYGAGLKGKIAEAMSFGLPVVTTSVGADGFPVKSGDHLLVADAPDEFAEAVVRLLADKELHRKISKNSIVFIKNHLSEEVVKAKVLDLFQNILTVPAKKISTLHRIVATMKYHYDRHIGWRLQHKSRE